MKKLTTLLTMALIALMSLSFTSCDEDSDIAYTLDGTWTGNMQVVYGGYESTRTVIRFIQNDGVYSGTGYWIDYYGGNYWHGNNYVANRITWTVRNGNIYIYLEDEDSEVVIYDYSLSDGAFYGYVDAENGKRARFTMYKDGGSYNWRGYDYWDDSWDYGYNKHDSSLDGLHVTSRAASDSVKCSVEKTLRKFPPRDLHRIN